MNPKMDLDYGVENADYVQAALVSLAQNLTFEDLSTADVDRCTLHIIDTFGSFVSGFFSEAAESARVVAQMMQVTEGASVLGTRIKVQPDVAAFVNATTSREAEQNDVYFPPIGGGNHPSDVLLPLFNAAEHAGSTGRELVTAIIIAYQVFLHIADQAKIAGFDQTMIAGIAVAVGAGKLLRLTPQQLSECISMVTVANNPINQSRRDTLTVWKAAAAGQAGRAGLFAAMLAKAGMKGPALPFTGQLGWSKIIGKTELDMQTIDPRDGHRLRLYDVMIKPRAACASAISSILAAEKAYVQIGDPQAIRKVLVATYESARVFIGADAIHWNPTTRESADHSIPYAVAATLVDGTAGIEQFMPARLFDPVIRDVLAKVEVMALDCPLGTKVIYRRVVTHLDKKWFTLAEIYSRADAKSGSLGSRIHKAEQEISAVLADETVHECLGIPVGTPMISARRTYFTANGERVRHLYARYHPENYRFLIDLQPGGGQPIFEGTISQLNTSD